MFNDSTGLIAVLLLDLDFLSFSSNYFESFSLTANKPLLIVNMFWTGSSPYVSTHNFSSNICIL